MANSFVVLGGGGLGRDLISVLHGLPSYQRQEFTLRGLLDTRDDPALFAHLGVPRLGSPLDFTPSPNDEVLVGVGNLDMKQEFVAALLKQGARFGRLVAEERTVGERATVGNSVISRGVRISTDVVIGDYVYIDSDATLGHDVTIGDLTHIGGRTFIAGGAKIGKSVMIHPCAAIASGVTIGDNAVIGMGAVVMKNVPANCTVFGNPARVIFTRPAKDAA